MPLYHGIFINSDNLIQIAADLKAKIKEIETCYNSIKATTQELDGSSETWQGEDQKIYYAALKSLTDKYEGNISKLTEIYEFLCKIIDDYETRDENYGKDLDRNADNLDM